jgi:hypothetical protein
MTRDINEHRTLANFWRPFERGAKLVATARVTDKEYVALGDGNGNRIMVALRTTPAHIVVNHEINYKWNDVFTHAGAELKEGDIATLCLTREVDSWTIQLIGGPKVTYLSPFAKTDAVYAEGAGAWQRFDLFHHGGPTI